MSLTNVILQKINDLTNAFNQQALNSRETHELPTASLPLNSTDFIRMQQNGASRKISATDLTGETPTPPYDDSWIQSAIDEKVEWKGKWVNASYSKNDQVLDGSYLMVANKDTNDKAAPQPTGADFYPYGGTIGSSNANTKQVMVGVSYKDVQAALFIKGFRIYLHVDQKYSVYIISDRGLPTETLGFISSFTAGSTGWVDYNIGSVLVPAGTSFDLIVVTSLSEPVTVDTIANYDYSTPGGSGQDPVAGEITHNNNETDVLNIHKTDDDGTDRSALLASLNPGDTIYDGIISWSVIGISDEGAYVAVSVLPASQSTDGTKAFTFSIVTAELVDYALDSGYWAGNTNVRGLENLGTGVYTAGLTLDDIIETDNQYNIDLKIQEVVISDDWDFQSSTDTLGGSSGSETTIEIVDDLTTQDATKALSANQGYVLDQKILNLPPPVDTSDFMLKATYDPDNNGTVIQADNADQLENQPGSYYDQSAHVSDTSIHLSATERAAINAASGPTGANPFATMDDVGSNFTSDEEDAIKGANTPSAANVFATMDDVSQAGGGDMLKSEYDSTDNGIVDDAEKLGAQVPSYYLDYNNLANAPTKFLDIITLSSDYSTANKDDDSEANLDVGNGEVVTLDSTGLTIGFHQQASNTGTQSFTVELAPGDTVVGQGMPKSVSVGYFAYYVLIRANTWICAFGQSASITGGDMLKSVYDPTDSGVVADSHKLGGKTPSEYAQLDQANVFTSWENKFNGLLKIKDLGLGEPVGLIVEDAGGGDNVQMLLSGTTAFIQTTEDLNLAPKVGGHVRINEKLYLGSNSDPTLGDHVGNRDYNDARYLTQKISTDITANYTLVEADFGQIKRVDVQTGTVFITIDDTDTQPIYNETIFYVETGNTGEVIFLGGQAQIDCTDPSPSVGNSKFSKIVMTRMSNGYNYWMNGDID